MVIVGVATALVDHLVRPSVSPLRSRIAAIALSQLGYRTDPPDTYCNRYSAYWYAGINDCGNANKDEEWCADFVSYVYKQAGYPFLYGERDGWDEYYAPNIQNQGFIYHSAASYIPHAGDVAFFDYNGGHVEIVAVGGSKPIFIYGDSGTIDKTTGNGDMAENTITNDGYAGQVIYYLSPT